MNNGTFDFNLFLKESKETLLNPKSYFSTMKISGGMIEPLIKAVIYGAVSGVIYFLWGILGLGSAVGGLFGESVGIMLFIWAIIAAVIGMFIGGVVLLIISSICKGNTDFEANVRVTAAIMVVVPISALFGFTMGINFSLGLIISLVIKLYGLWLLYHGLVEALKGKPETAKIVSYVLIALMVIFLIAGMSAKNRATRLLDKYNKDARELLKDSKK